MSSDSSEEENMELIREAANHEFNSPLLGCTSEKCPVQINRSSTKRSLRHEDKEEQFMGITPECQKFVAAQLAKFIDSQLKEVNAPSKPQNYRTAEGGIRLFTLSTNVVACEESVDVEVAYSKKVKRKSLMKKSNEISEQEKCKAAAVTAEWILTKEAVSGWEHNTKGILETMSVEDVEIRSTNTENKMLSDATSMISEVRKKLKQEKYREKNKLE